MFPQVVFAKKFHALERHIQIGLYISMQQYAILCMADFLGLTQWAYNFFDTLHSVTMTSDEYCLKNLHPKIFSDSSLIQEHVITYVTHSRTTLGKSDLLKKYGQTFKIMNATQIIHSWCQMCPNKQWPLAIIWRLQ